MTFGTFPAQLANAIQQNFLERMFIDSLHPVLAYREIADQEVFPARIGQTITKTKMGLMIPNTTPLNPSSNTNIDNGLQPQQYSDEQYTLQILQYPNVAPDINLIDDETTIASFAMRNAMNLGITQASTLDLIARNALFNSYMGGNTVVTVTLGSPGTTVQIDDTRGFQTVVVNGNVIPVSPSNPLPVYINGTLYNVTGFANDLVNVSSAAVTGGTSGSITTATNVSTTNGTAGRAVVGYFAQPILRPNGKLTTAALSSSDTLTMQSILAAVALLRNNAVPTVRGAYNMYVNATSMQQLYQDPEFQILNRGVSTRDPVYRDAWIFEQFLDVRFIRTTQTFVQSPQLGAPVPVSQTVQRPILCGSGALVEGIFDPGLSAIRQYSGNVSELQTFPPVINLLGDKFKYEGFYLTLRNPIDRLGQIISMASNYIGNFVVPTDVTTNSLVIPTANNSYYKRAVIIETA